MQPYPGDPENYLQYKGRRFVAYDISDHEMTLWDQVLGTDFIISIDDLSQENYEVGTWYASHCAMVSKTPVTRKNWYQTTLTGDIWAWNAAKILELGTPYSEGEPEYILNRFRIYPRRRRETSYYEINDVVLELQIEAEYGCLHDPMFDLVSWYQNQITLKLNPPIEEPMSGNDKDKITLRPLTLLEGDLALIQHTWGASRGLRPANNVMSTLELNGQQVEPGTYPTLVRHNIRHKSEQQRIPKPLVIVAKLNGHPVRALINSGSLGDFMSSTVAEQLKVKKQELTDPIAVQLAVQGSRSKVNYGTTVRLEYQRIIEDRDAMDIPT
ncbi:hypothetical protein C0993_000422 [Termitomyces sp. T159_Od127]|nr:hypothetical protein C0993_000422 [Termitomyces sp. T159_Od127]